MISQTSQITDLLQRVEATEEDLTCLNDVGVLAGLEDPVEFNGTGHWTVTN